MSQPPSGPPPPAPPPGGYYGPPPKRGHVLELVVGALLGGFDVVASGVLGVIAIGAVGYDTSAASWVFFVAPAIGLLIPVVLLFFAPTRWWGVGILIGFFLTLIVLGGACVALIAGLSG